MSFWTPIRQAQPLIWKRLVEWLYEMPGIVAGLWKLSKPFRLTWMPLILALNCGIAFFDIAVTVAFTEYFNELRTEAAYAVIVFAAAWPMIRSQVPYFLILPYARDFVISWFVRPWFRRHVSLLCADQEEARLKSGRERDSDVDGMGHPIIKEGSNVAWNITDMILREPPVLARSAWILLLLCGTSSGLAVLLVVGMVINFYLTLLLDALTFDEYGIANEYLFEADQTEIDYYREFSKEKKRNLKARLTLYAYAFRKPELVRLIIGDVRDAIGFLIRLGSIFYITYLFMHHEASYADVYWFTQTLPKMSDPLSVLYQVQSTIMPAREALRRLGLMCNVNFSIVRPREMTHG